MVTTKPRKLSNKQILSKRIFRQRRRKPRSINEVCVFAYKQFKKKIKSFSFKKFVNTLSSYVPKSTLFIILIILGIALSFGSVFHYTYSKTVLSFKGTPILTIDEAIRKASPKQIELPYSNTALTLESAQIESGLWQISDTTATHLVQSANPGERGNIVIYGHNKKHIFGNLYQLKEGNIVTIISNDGTKHEYKIRETKIVDPSAVEEIAPTDHEVLTLFTCTGFMDSKRLVIKAYPYRVSSY